MNTLYIARKMKLKREMYFALLLDRKSAGPVMIGCSEVCCQSRCAVAELGLRLLFRQLLDPVRLLTASWRGGPGSGKGRGLVRAGVW